MTCGYNVGVIMGQLIYIEAGELIYTYHIYHRASLIVPTEPLYEIPAQNVHFVRRRRVPSRNSLLILVARVL